jgi:hypothetical protein
MPVEPRASTDHAREQANGMLQIRRRPLVNRCNQFTPGMQGPS